MAPHIATCRYCGAQGYEDETDPMPGVCPACFHRKLERAFESVEAGGEEPEDVRLMRLGAPMLPMMEGN